MPETCFVYQGMPDVAAASFVSSLFLWAAAGRIESAWRRWRTRMPSPWRRARVAHRRTSAGVWSRTLDHKRFLPRSSDSKHGCRHHRRWHPRGMKQADPERIWWVQPSVPNSQSPRTGLPWSINRGTMGDWMESCKTLKNSWIVVS